MHRTIHIHHCVFFADISNYKLENFQFCHIIPPLSTPSAQCDDYLVSTVPVPDTFIPFLIHQGIFSPIYQPQVNAKVQQALHEMCLIYAIVCIFEIYDHKNYFLLTLKTRINSLGKNSCIVSCCILRLLISFHVL